MGILDKIGLNKGLKSQLAYFLKGWHAGSEAISIPSYLNFSPASLKKQLSHIFMLEMDAAGGIFFRLCGTANETLHGCYLSGTQLSDHYPDVNEAEAINEIYAQAIIQNVGLIRYSQLYVGSQRTPAPIISLCLPMVHHNVLGGNLLLCISFFDKKLESPLLSNNNKVSNTALTDRWMSLSYLEIENKFNADLFSDRVQNFLGKSGVSLDQFPLSDLTDLIAEEEIDAVTDITNLDFTFSKPGLN